MILLLLILLPFSIAWNGYVLQFLWAWFASPIFDFPLLTLLQAIGLRILIGSFNIDIQKQKDKSINEKYEDIAYELVESFVAPGFMLIFGWFIHKLI